MKTFLKGTRFWFSAYWVNLEGKARNFTLLDISRDGDLKFGAFGFNKKGLNALSPLTD